MKKTVFIITFLSYFITAECIMFYLQPNTQKCLREELKANAILAGEYEVSEHLGQKVDYKVTDSQQHVLAQNKDVTKGKFSVVTETQDIVEICFISHVPSHQRGVKHEVSLNTKRGVEAKPYEGMGEAAKLKPIEVELKKLEDLTDSIVQDFVQMRDREKEMRDTNESTNNRVLYLSIFSMCCLFGLAVWQVLYLRWFFKAKKLIE